LVCPSVISGGRVFFEMRSETQSNEEAWARIQRIRDEALARVPRPLFYETSTFGRRVLGPDVVPLTWERMLYLAGENNAVACGLPVDKQATMRALYIISPEFRPGDRTAWKRFRRKRRMSRKKWIKIAGALRSHFDEAFAEAPSVAIEKGKKREGGFANEHWLASHVHYFASVYGWTFDEIVKLPVAVTFMLVNCRDSGSSHSDASKRTPRFNPAADRANGQRLREKREQMRNKGLN